MTVMMMTVVVVVTTTILNNHLYVMIMALGAQEDARTVVVSTVGCSCRQRCVCVVSTSNNTCQWM